jgi:hypothetical protein
MGASEWNWLKRVFGSDLNYRWTIGTGGLGTCYGNKVIGNGRDSLDVRGGDLQIGRGFAIITNHKIPKTQK